MNGDAGGALSRYRVLDLTTDTGQLAGRIFADLGADVVKIEPRQGDPSRASGPFYGDDPSDPDKSLFWAAYNAGKRSIALDIQREADKETLKGLIPSADFLLESHPPGYLASLGLGYADLEKLNPGLIMASITPFGQTGPRALWKGPDLVCWAMGGYMWMTGEPEKAPLRISHPPQAYLHASAIAVTGCLMAHFCRVKTGLGQHVDVAAQQCPSWMLTNTYAFWDLKRINLGRGGIFRQFGANNIRTVWKALDGYITFMFSGGAIGAKGQRRVVELMDRAGSAPEWIKNVDWEGMSAFSVHEDQLSDITREFGAFFETQKKENLLAEAVKSGIMLAPVNTIADVMNDPQLIARDFWREIHIAPDRTLKFPGPPVKMSRTPWKTGKGAPRMDEHREKILSDWTTKCGEECRVRFNAHVRGKNALPLDGIKVLDFTSTVLGPSTTRYLADHGAVVVRVESLAHPETLRIATPFAGDSPHIDRSGYFAVHNAGKLSLSLNMKKEKARFVVEKLINWADIMIESFAPGVMKRWGLDYEAVKRINPDIIMASTCLQGQTGPHAAHRGYGQMATAIAGWFELTGWPEGPPLDEGPPVSVP